MSQDPAIPEIMTLSALQRHIHELCVARGWDRNTTEARFLLFIEEVGELAKAMRRTFKLQIELDNPDKPVWADDQVKANLAEEFADVLNYVLDLANYFDIDLEKAYADKVSHIARRKWA